MNRRITGFHKDEHDDWVAELSCGHHQHVRHKPPLVSRAWVLTDAGRISRIGFELDCKRCDEHHDEATDELQSFSERVSE